MEEIQPDKIKTKWINIKKNETQSVVLRKVKQVCVNLLTIDLLYMKKY